MFAKEAVVTPLELRLRRRMLGVDAGEFGRCLSLACPMPDGSGRPPVDAATVEDWEQGEPLPVWCRSTLRWAFADIDTIRERMIDAAYEDARHRNAMDEDSVIRVRVYLSDFAFWLDWPQFHGWPRVLWNTGAMRAVDDLADRYGMPVGLLPV